MIPIAKPSIDSQEIENVVEVLKSGMLASGEWTRRFECEFADYIGTKYAVTTTSGTTALDIALKALDIERGDEVIVPDFTFIATANVVLFQNARPVFVDVKGRNEITNAGYRKRFGISDRTALRDLTVICEKGIFQKVGARGRETKYILTRHKPDISINKYNMSAVSNASSLISRAARIKKGLIQNKNAYQKI